jgi:hypothetical protein
MKKHRLMEELFECRVNLRIAEATALRMVA